MQFCWKLRPLMRELPQIVESCFERLRTNRIYIKIWKTLFSCTNGHFLPICTLIGLINVTEEQILNYFTSEQFFSSEEENIFILSEPTSRPHKLSPPPPPLLPLVLLFFIQTENRKKGLTLFCLFQSRFYEQFLKPFLLDPDNFKNRSPPKQSTTLGTLRW